MKRALGVLAAGNFIVGTGAFAVAGLTLQMADDFDVTSAAAVQLLTIYTLTYALTSPFLVAFAAPYGLKHALIAALVLYAIGNLLVGAAASFEVLLVARIVTALGAGLFSPLAYALAARLGLPEMRARAVSFVIMGLTIANVVGLPLATVVGGAVGWQWVFLGVGGLGLVATLALWVTLPHTECETLQTIAALRRAIGDRALLVLVGVSLLQYGALFGLFANVAPMVAAGGAVDKMGVAWLLFLFGCGSVVGNLGGGWAADRWGAAPVVNAALSLLIPTAALFPLACHTMAGASIIAFACGLVGLAFIGPQQHRVLSVPGQSAPVALALNVSAIYLGGSVGASACAMMASLGAQAIGLGAALFGAAALLLSITLDRLVIGSAAVGKEVGKARACSRTSGLS